MGKCICEKNWLPPNCSELFCGQSNCSSHGLCLPEGCACYPGYCGTDCNKGNMHFCYFFNLTDEFCYLFTCLKLKFKKKTGNWW